MRPSPKTSPAELNALSTPIMDGLLEALPRLARDSAVGAIVLTGAARAFCAGGDVKSMAEGRVERSIEEAVIHLRGRMEVSRLLHEIPKPTIAMVNGPAAGARSVNSVRSLSRARRAAIGSCRSSAFISNLCASALSSTARETGIRVDKSTIPGRALLLLSVYRALESAGQARKSLSSIQCQMPWSPPSCGTDAASSPHGIDQACDRINEKTTDNEQDHPYQIVDELLEFGESSSSPLKNLAMAMAS